MNSQKVNDNFLIKTQSLGLVSTYFERPYRPVTTKSIPTYAKRPWTEKNSPDLNFAKDFMAVRLQCKNPLFSVNAIKGKNHRCHPLLKVGVFAAASLDRSFCPELYDFINGNRSKMSPINKNLASDAATYVLLTFFGWAEGHISQSLQQMGIEPLIASLFEQDKVEILICEVSSGLLSADESEYSFLGSNVKDAYVQEI